jgi:uncharacterized protein (TIGR00369 family)
MTATTSATGIELLREIASGAHPNATMAETMGMSIAEVDEGRVVFEADPSDRLLNPAGTVHGGFAATMLDSAMACAVHSTLPAGDTYTTVDLAVKLLKPIRVGVGRLRCEGTIVHVGGRVGTAEGRLVGEDGTVYATGTTTCLITRGDR